MKVKVCGLKEKNNVSALQKLALDYMGFIFYEKSPRNISDTTCEFVGFDHILAQGIKKVGVFVDAPITFVLEKIAAFDLDYVQLHGKENVFYCQSLKKKGVKIIKAFSIHDTFSFTQTGIYEYDCDFFLFDTKGKNPGGNGTQFDWSILDHYKGNTPFFLSGGISPESIEAIRSLNHPKLYAIDVNSKFEIEPGLKDIEKVSDFVHRLRSRSTKDW